MLTKEMLRMDTWYSEEGTRLLVHLDYPPFASIFEMISCKFGAWGYSESLSIFGLHMLSISLIVPPIIDSFESKDNRKMYDNVVSMLLANVIIIFLIKAFSGNADGGFNTIYKDTILVLLFVYAMLLIHNGNAVKSKFDYLGVILSTSAILITKQMGMAYALLIWFYYILSELINKKAGKPLEKVARTIVLVLIPTVTHNIWSTYIRGLGLSGQFDLNKITVQSIRQILGDTQAETIQRQTLNDFINAIFTTKIDATYIQITYATALLIVVVVSVFIWVIGRKIWDKKDMIAFDVTLICGTFGYALTMVIVYLFCFSEGEMRGLASYQRYMSGYMLGEMLILIVILYESLNIVKYIKLWQLSIATIVCVLALNPSNLKIFTPGIFSEEKNNDCIEAARMLEENIQGDKTVFILADDTIRSQYYINYYADDIRPQLCYTDVLNANMADDNVVESIKNTIFKEDYIYIKDINDNFNVAFAYINNGNDYYAGQLYEISDVNGEIKITLVNG
jgi:hypothetical protein